MQRTLGAVWLGVTLMSAAPTPGCGGSLTRMSMDWGEVDGIVRATPPPEAGEVPLACKYAAPRRGKRTVPR